MVTVAVRVKRRIRTAYRFGTLDKACVKPDKMYICIRICAYTYSQLHPTSVKNICCEIFSGRGLVCLVYKIHDKLIHPDSSVRRIIDIAKRNERRRDERPAQCSRNCNNIVCCQRLDVGE